MHINKKNIFLHLLFTGYLSLFGLFGIQIASAISIGTDTTTRFLTIADIHFQPFTTCADTIPCPVIENLRRASISQWDEILASYDKQTPKYKQDTNYSLLVSALAEFKNAAEVEHASFALVLGDFLGHNFKNYFTQYSSDKSPTAYRAFVRKTMLFLNNKFAKALPGLDIYPVIGNNDSYQEDYTSDPYGDFFNDMASIWSRLIHNRPNQLAMYDEFPIAGYYAADIPQQPELRLIVLNSVLFSSKAQGNDIDEAALTELNWLHGQLQHATLKHQKVIIALHIPPGIDIYASLVENPFSIVELWQSKYTQRFQAELQQFASNILVILPAHLHMDWFQILSSGYTGKIPLSGTPAISPIVGNNPAFKAYQYSTNPARLDNFVTYFYSINNQKWDKEYNFNDIYQPNCHNCQVIEGMKQIQQTGDLSEYYKAYYSVSTISPISNKWLPYYWCQIQAIQALEYRTCVAQNR